MRYKFRFTARHNCSLVSILVGGERRFRNHDVFHKYRGSTDGRRGFRAKIDTLPPLLLRERGEIKITISSKVKKWLADF